MSGIKAGVDAMAQAQNIGFVEFTTGLIRGVYEVVVDSQVNQLQAYSELLNDVSGTVADYQLKVSGLTEAGASDASNTARLDEYVKDVLLLGEAVNGAYEIDEAQYKNIDGHFDGEISKFSPPDLIVPDESDPENIVKGSIKEEKLKEIIYSKITKKTNEQYALLKQLLEMGFARVDTKQGYVETALSFSISAMDRQSAYARSTDVKANSWSASAEASVGAKIWSASAKAKYASSRVQVATLSTNQASSTNLKANMIGRVRVDFATTQFASATSET